MQKKYAGHRHHLILALDNPALEFLLSCRQELFPGTPLVFAGINGFRPEMLSGQNKITGVAQRHDLAGTLRLALNLHPETRKVLLLHDYTESGLALREEAEALHPEFAGKVELVYSPQVSWPELEKLLRDLPPHSLVLILTYVTDAEGRVFSRKESTRLIVKAASVPVYAVHETLLGYGIVGGMLLSGCSHGAEAAELALKVLQGTDPDVLPVQFSASRPMFDYAQLDRFGISEAKLPSGSIVVNRPQSFYERYKQPLLVTGAIITVLTSLALGLLVAIFRLKRSESRVRESEETYRHLFTTMVQGVVYQDGAGKIISLNPAAAAILGRSREELMGKTLWDQDWQALKADGTPYPEEEHPVRLALATGAEVRQVLMGIFNPRDQEYRWLIVTAMPQFQPGEERPYQVYTTFEDVTARREAEEKILASLKEKEILLKEIHHRVKNNLQIITSLLALQARYGQGKNLQEILRDCQNRIRSMALIHESLYGSENLAAINFRRYLEKLVSRILLSHDPEAQNLKTIVAGDEVYLNINQAVPCGLIANELIVNALKHAFQPKDPGQIYVSVEKHGDRYMLTVQDNGRGLPPDLDLESPASFGWLMVKNLARQLGGDLKVKSNRGTIVKLIF